MAVTTESFVDAFDEFRKTDRNTVEAKLRFAKLEVAPAVWGPRTDVGVMYMCAHLISLGPAGQNAKLKPSEEMARTVYGQHFMKMQRAVTFGLRVAGLPAASAFEDPR